VIEMSHILYILFLWLVVSYADFKMTKHNMQVSFNGLGSIPLVLRGESRQPMQYRVLIPWLCYLFNRESKKEPPLRTYLHLRWFFILTSLVSSYWYFSVLSLSALLPVSILALFYVWVALYDYTDIYVEITILALSFGVISTQPVFALPALAVLAIIGTLNRETTIIVPLALAFSGMYQDAIIVGVFVASGLYIPRAFYGKKERYCSFNQTMNNLVEIKKTYAGGPPIVLNEYTIFFISLAICTTVYCVVGEMGPIDLAVLLVCVLLIVPAKWREVRVFAPMILSVAPKAAVLL